MRVLLVPNTEKSHVLDVVRSLDAWLAATGHEPLLAEADAVVTGLEAHAAQPGGFGELDLAVALGGDGTILKTVHLLGGVDVPILGINLGRLGFLSGSDEDGMRVAVEDALAGRCTIERRSTLEVRIEAGGRQAGVHHALNEVFVGRGIGGRAVFTAVSVNGTPLMATVCDGMLVATPTGSTAYALSTGGPIISPDVRCMLLTPAAPHTLLTRPLVLGPDDEVEIALPDPPRADACVVVDGDLIKCRTALDRVIVRVGGHDVSLVKVGGRGFYPALRDTFFGR